MPDQQQQQDTDGTSGQQQSQQQTPPDFDTWLKAQPDDVKALVENGMKGLKSALTSERQQRQDIERQLREAAAKLDKGSEMQKNLESLAGKMQVMEQQADFYDQAHKLGVNDLKLAFIVAREESLIDAKGRINFDELKKAHPALFGAAPGPGRVDGGAGKQPPAGGMNALLKEALEGR